MATIPTDPISSVADAVSSLSNTIRVMSAETHPFMYYWNIHRLIKRLAGECKHDTRLNPVDLCGACTHDLDAAEQQFILHCVQQELGLIK